MNKSDKRCCGSDVCIINDVGECWCGQVWDGEKMVASSLISDPKKDDQQEASLMKPKSQE